MAKARTPEIITLPDVELGERQFRILVPEEVINNRTTELATRMLGDYDGRSMHFVYLATGGIFWGPLLAREIRRQDPNVQMTHDTLQMSSYGQSANSSGVVRQLSRLAKPWLIKDSHTILTDEVVDKSLTVSHVVRTLRAGVAIDGNGGCVRPTTIAIAALTNKQNVHNGTGHLGTPITVNYPGFVVPGDVWLMGCGMDHLEYYREDPNVYGSALHGGPHEASYTMPDTISPFAGV